MHIDVRIPYEPGKALGYSCNRALETVEDWVLILDHDVFLVNPHWYDISLRAIETVGHAAGFITCVTNAIGCPLQRAHVGNSQDMDFHLQTAMEIETAQSGIVEEINGTRHVFSGFFILTHKKAWLDAGGFENKFIGMDNAYHRAVVRAGYKAYVMRDLYVYHRYKRLWKKEEQKS